MMGTAVVLGGIAIASNAGASAGPPAEVACPGARRIVIEGVYDAATATGPETAEEALQRFVERGPYPGAKDQQFDKFEAKQGVAAFQARRSARLEFQKAPGGWVLHQVEICDNQARAWAGRR